MPRQNGAAHSNTMTTDDETTALLGKPKGHAVTQRIKQHLTDKLSRDWADIVLLACYVATGLLDSSAFYIYGCFVSMQTGNTLYLGLGIIEPEADNRWIKSAASIIAFCLGSYIFSRLHQVFVSKKRWVLMASYTLQMLLITGAALVVTFGPKVTKESPITVYNIVPICLLAFQAAGQAVTSRVLDYNCITSIVLTSSYCDLFADPGLFTKGLAENPKRNRRAVAPFMLLGGAILGGLFAHSSIGLAGALWTAVAMKFLIVVAWLSWKADNDADEE